MMSPSKEHAAKHYDDLKSKPFFKGLVDYMSCGTPVVCMVWEGKDVIKTGRVMLGATNPNDSAPGYIIFYFLFFIFYFILFYFLMNLFIVLTYLSPQKKKKKKTIRTIRGDNCVSIGRNLIHGSDSFESATGNYNNDHEKEFI